MISENEIVKNYGSFNSIPDINRITNQMAFKKSSLNTNDNFYTSKKSNNLNKLSSKKNELKSDFPKNQVDSSDSSYLSSLDSNLNYYEDKNKKVKSENDSLIKKKSLSNAMNKDKDLDGNYLFIIFFNFIFFK